MWLTFLCAYMIIILLLFIPGFFFFRSLSFSKLNSILFAPLFSIAWLCTIGVFFNQAGIFASAQTIGAPLLLAPLALFLLRKHHICSHAEQGINWGIVGLYIILGFTVGVYAYVLPLDGPESIVQTYDNVFHYNVIESFMQSGSWSTLSVDAYLGNQAFDPFPGTGFYPAGWHLISAFAASALQTNAPLAANAANFAFISIVFPISIFALLRAIFPDKHILIAIGSIACVIQIAIPWMLYAVWPLFPNGASLCACMLVAAIFISAFSKTDNKAALLPHALGFLSGIASLAFLQPNSIFALIVFLMPFLLWQIALYGSRNESRISRTARIRNCLIFLGAFTILLMLLFKLPFLQPTITYYWPPLYSPIDCLKAIITWSLATEAAQIHITILLLCGIALLLTKCRDNCWLILSLLSGLFIFFVVAGTPESPAKHFFGGYWYNDPYRIAALCGLFSIPICTAGIYAISSLLNRLFKQKEITEALCGACCSIAIATVTFMPALPTSQGFKQLKGNAEGLNSSAWNYLDYDETRFLVKVMNTVPQDALIINQPFDGSMYAYGKTGINLYYRLNTNYGISDGETPESKAIRKGLEGICSDNEVRSAVSEVGASYVLLLKPDFKEIGMYYPAYKPEEWAGIDGITDQTPGFEPIAKEGEMRLYKITD